MTADLQNPAFHDEDTAREALEAMRWPDGPYCPHCGNADQDKIAKGLGKMHRPGLYYCAECNGQFTVTVGTVMERSHIPLSKWLFAMHLMGAEALGKSRRVEAAGGRTGRLCPAFWFLWSCSRSCAGGVSGPELFLQFPGGLCSPRAS